MFLWEVLGTESCFIHRFDTVVIQGVYTICGLSSKESFQNETVKVYL